MTSGCQIFALVNYEIFRIKKYSKMNKIVLIIALFSSVIFEQGNINLNAVFDKCILVS